MSDDKVIAPDWSYWPASRNVKQWQAVALSLNIDPDSLRHSPQGWMAGPGAGPVLLSESFPSAEVENEFQKRLDLLANCLPGKPMMALCKFAEWADSVNLTPMPSELAALANQSPPVALVKAQLPAAEQAKNKGCKPGKHKEHLTVLLDGLEAIPVRAVPFITGWEMSPDRIAAVLAHDDFIFQTIRGEPIALTAYHLVDGKPHPMLPKEWNSVLGTLITRSSNLVASAWDSAVKIAKPQQGRDSEPLPEMSLSDWLELSPEEREQRLLGACDDDPIANIRHTAHVLTRDQWKREAVEILPAGVFVWRDDFEQAFHRVYARLLMIDEKPGDREMNFSPWMPEETRCVVMDGFAVGSPQHQVQGQLAEDASETVPAPEQAKSEAIAPSTIETPPAWDTLTSEEKKASWDAMSPTAHREKANELMKKHKGNKTHAAAEVGISPQALRRYLEESEPEEPEAPLPVNRYTVGLGLIKHKRGKASR